MRHLNIFFSFFAQSVAFIFQGGEYVLTDMFYEPETCKASRFYDILKTDTSLSLPHCGIQCFANPDCRRIMFDRKTKKCSMFKSGENCYDDENIEDKVCYRLKSICSDVNNCTRCPIGYYGDTCQHIIQDCSDGYNKAVATGSLLSYIQPVDNGSIIEVKCEFKWKGKTIFQHRDTNCLETDFNRTWDEYVNGFGKVHGEYWLGLRHIYDILQNHNNFELNVIVVTGNTLYGYYSEFNLTNSDDGYKFYCDRFEPNSNKPLGDSLTNGTNSIIGRPFSTYDQDYSNNNCPDRFMGGWWYLDDPVCSRANPNGRRNDSNDDARIQWRDNFGISYDIREVQLRLKRE